MEKWLKEKETLDFLINVEKLSYDKIGKRYECSGTNIKKVAKKLGINIPQKRKINPCETFHKGIHKTLKCLNCGKEFFPWEDGKSKHLFCSTDCSNEYKHKESYRKFLEGGEYYMRANWNASHFKKDFLEEQNGVCAICGCKPEHNGKPLVFVLDHIDGDASNNHRENLRLICPNCDSQLDTFKSKNKHSARYNHRYGNKNEIEKLKQEINELKSKF